MSIFYERVHESIIPRYWMKAAYYDIRDRRITYVMFPFNYFVEFAWFLHIKWCMFKNKQSWIDKMVEEACKAKGNRYNW